MAELKRAAWWLLYLLAMAVILSGLGALLQLAVHGRVDLW